MTFEGKWLKFGTEVITNLKDEGLAVEASEPGKGYVTITASNGNKTLTFRFSPYAVFDNDPAALAKKMAAQFAS